MNSAASPRPADIRELTSLRFLAAMAIVLHHYLYYYKGSEVVAAVVSRLYLGVDLFFVLSGFILLHVYQDSLLSGNFRFGAFIWNRLAKIYPVHLVTLVLAALVVDDVGADPGAVLWTFGANLTMVHAWGTTDTLGYNFPSWSVSAEFFAYLLFAPLARMVLVVPRCAALWGAVALFLASYAAADHWGAERLTFMTHGFGVARIMPEFILGMALYRYRGASAALTRRAGLIAGITLLILSARMLNATHDGITVLLLAVLIFALSEMSLKPSGTFLRAAPLVWLGEISYAIYMVHIFVFWTVSALVSDPYAGVGPLLVYLALVVIAGAATHAWIEVPARRWLRGKARRGVPDAARTPAA